MSPEEKARQQIDAQLLACGWIVQDYRAVDFSARRGVALREVPLKVSPLRNLPSLEVIAADLAAALEQFATIAEDPKR